MDDIKCKKTLAMLLAVAIIGVIFAISANGQQYRGAYSIPGLEEVSLHPGTNTVALSASVATRQQDRVFFQVNSFAVLDRASRSATVYALSSALPAILDMGNDEIQIDISRLQPSIRPTYQASTNDLYSILRPTVNTLMVVAQVTQQPARGSQTELRVLSLTVITPDGQSSTFTLNSPMSVVVDASSSRVYAEGFPQLYTLVNAFISNVQNHYYTSVISNIVAGPTIVVTPPAAYPVLTPIAFPGVWPVYYPVPVPVPIPVRTVTPRPPRVSPSARPSGMPTASPVIRPTRTPASPPAASISPSVRPTHRPAISASPIVSLVPPVASPRPSVRPTAGTMPTRTPGAGSTPGRQPASRAGPRAET